MQKTHPMAASILICLLTGQILTIWLFLTPHYVILLFLSSQAHVIHKMQKVKRWKPDSSRMLGRGQQLDEIWHKFHAFFRQLEINIVTAGPAKQTKQNYHLG